MQGNGAQTNKRIEIALWLSPKTDMYPLRSSNNSNALDAEKAGDGQLKWRSPATSQHTTSIIMSREALVHQAILDFRAPHVKTARLSIRSSSWRKSYAS